MKSILRATAILGSASVVNILLGLVSAKVTAVLLGPSGFGLMALYQALVTLVVMVAALGLPTALVRAAARPIAEGDAHGEAVLRRTVWVVTGLAACAAVIMMVLGQNGLSRFALGAVADKHWILFIAPAVVLSLCAGVVTAVLNARRRVGDLARVSMLSALLSLPATVFLVWYFRTDGVAPAVAANMLVNFCVGFFYYRRSAAGGQAAAAAAPPSGPEVRDAAKGLLGFGIPFMLSLVAGAGVQAILPILVLHALGPAEVGLSRAASAIAVNYLSVILAAMAQDYFPRVAGAPEDPATLGRIINEQLRLVLLLAGPVVIAMIGAVPYLVPLLYSSKFAGAATLLQWQLIGDLFKFSTWTMSFVIMVRMGGRTFFLTELAVGLVLLALSWFGMKAWGLPGLGVAFLATGACACALNWAVLRRSIALSWSAENLLLFLLLGAAMTMLRIAASFASHEATLAIAVLLAASFGGYSLRVFWGELGGRAAVRTWLKRP